MTFLVRIPQYGVKYDNYLCDKLGERCWLFEVANPTPTAEISNFNSHAFPFKHLAAWLVPFFQIIGSSWKHSPDCFKHLDSCFAQLTCKQKDQRIKLTFWLEDNLHNIYSYTCLKLQEVTLLLLLLYYLRTCSITSSAFINNWSGPLRCDYVHQSE